MENQAKTNNDDPLYKLKYIGWCRSQLPPDEAEFTFEDFVNYAKHFLCTEKRVLFNDPVWDNYTPHEILIEFFAVRFDKDEDFRNEMKATFSEVKEEDLKWFEEMEKKYKDLEFEESF